MEVKRKSDNNTVESRFDRMRLCISAACHFVLCKALLSICRIILATAACWMLATHFNVQTILMMKRCEPALTHAI